MNSVMQDLRYAARLLRKRAAFSLLAIATLALGIGANVAIFSLVNGVLLKPVPLPDSGRIAFFTRTGDVSLPDRVDWRARSHSFDSIALFLRTWDFDRTGQGEPEKLNGSVAEPDFFRVLGVQPVLGRFYGKSDDRKGGPRVAVLGFDYWKRHFGGDRSVLGQTLRLSDHDVQVIGVAPPETDFLHGGVDLYVPPALETPWALEERGTNNFDAIGRLRPGVSIEKGSAEIVAISRDLAREYPRTNAHKIVQPILAFEFLVRGIRPALIVLLGAVALVLLLATANLASLLARASGRRPEMALRVALGAGRGRIVRQLLAEGLLLSSVGGALGVALAAAGKDALLALAPGALPGAAEITLDARALIVATALTLATGVVFALAPAVGLGRVDPGAALQGGGRGVGGGYGRHRLLAAVAAGEIALACILLIGSGLLLESFSRLAGVPLGFAPSHVLTAQLVLPEARYAESAAQTRAFTAIVERLRAIPGVESASSIIGAPLQPGGIGGSLRFEGRDEPKPEDRPSARAHPVVGDYFRTMRLPIVRGRAFTASDREDSEPVAVVNREFVRMNFGSADPVGKRIAWNGWTESPHWMTIVGVAADARTPDLTAPDDPSVYTPYAQRPVTWQRFGTLVLRTAAMTGTYARALREAVWSVDRDLTISGIATMEEDKASLLAPQRFSALLLSVFGGAALLLALQGIVGVLSYSVAQRRREIGIRVALGATPRDVFAAILGRALRLTLVGLACGLTAALGFGRLISGLLFGIGATDAATFSSAAAIVLVTALVACGIPALRAARVDPMIAMRG